MRFRHGGIEEKGQKGAGEQQDDEGVQGHFTEHEGPVVGEDLAAELLEDSGSADALVDEVGDPADFGGRSVRCFSSVAGKCIAHDQPRSQ